MNNMVNNQEWMPKISTTMYHFLRESDMGAQYPAQYSGASLLNDSYIITTFFMLDSNYEEALTDVFITSYNPSEEIIKVYHGICRFTFPGNVWMRHLMKPDMVSPWSLVQEYLIQNENSGHLHDDSHNIREYVTMMKSVFEKDNSFF